MDLVFMRLVGAGWKISFRELDDLGVGCQVGSDGSYIEFIRDWSYACLDCALSFPVYFSSLDLHQCTFLFHTSWAPEGPLNFRYGP
jgi:hypothetical protein